MCVSICFLGNFPQSFSQETNTEKKVAPALQSNRAEEDYSYLKAPDSNPYQPYFGEDLKFIALNPDRSVYATLGGGYRARIELFDNKDWTSEDQSYYSQRLSIHAGVNFGTKLRLFGELYHGYTSDTLQLFQSDDIAWHQAFVEFSSQLSEKQRIKVRLGRQELAFGANRLIGTREGTNIRRSFDLGKAVFSQGKANVSFFYGKEVVPQFEAFDNEFNLFDSEATNPEIWGVYIQLPANKAPVTDEIYYIGFGSKAAGFSDVFGQETRHTIGLRRFGKLGKQFTFNTELIYQFGELGGSKISAFDIETDWKFILTEVKWRPTFGIKLDFSSGDRDMGDDKIQTFNPLFVNPAIYSLAAVNTPANLSSFHPNFTLFPHKDLSIYVDYALFYRTSREDGLYTPLDFRSDLQMETLSDTSEMPWGFLLNTKSTAIFHAM